MSDIKLIDDAIQLYILANRRAPDFNGACPIQNNLDTTCYANDMTGPSAPSPYTWSQFRADIAPYITKLPVDPCGLKCYKDDGVAGHYGDKFFYYRYNAPAYLPGAGVMGSNPAPVATDYLIGAQSLETRSSFVIGFGSF